MARKARTRIPADVRFWAKVDKSAGPDGCWLWMGTRHKATGYGYFSREQGKVGVAHRFAYELLVGPIPEGMELDHVKARGCTNRHCVNPAHLEPVTHVVNCRRGGNATKTQCIHGHPFEGDNLIITAKGHRLCRICVAAVQRRINARLKAERAAAGRSKDRTHCIHGHPLSGDNLYQRNLERGHRKCVTCAREAAKQSTAKRKEARVAA